MPRPIRCRRICAFPENTLFLPAEAAARGRITLTVDEYETIRLMDYEGRTHAQCARIMQISRTTVTEIYASARKKLARALTEGRGIEIGGGQVRVCDRTEPCGQGPCPAV